MTLQVPKLSFAEHSLQVHKFSKSLPFKLNEWRNVQNYMIDQRSISIDIEPYIAILYSSSSATFLLGGFLFLLDAGVVLELGVMMM